MAPRSEIPAIALDVRDLRMRYGTKDVLAGMSFTAKRGEVLALLGPERRMARRQSGSELARMRNRTRSKR